MLVLTRKCNQSIMIGDDIEVTVLAVSGDKVRIGIEAPKSVPVFRDEVYVQIKGSAEAQPEPTAEERAEVNAALDELGRG